MVARSWAFRLVAALAGAGLLIGCASGGAGSTAPTVAPTAIATTVETQKVTPAPVPTATVMPTARVYGPVTVVTGVETCEIDFGTIAREEKFVQHARNGTATCTHTMNDPRVTGTYTANYNLDYWGTDDHTNGALVQWFTARLVTAGGAWEGRATGVWSADGGDTIVGWWTGTGAYAGLTYFSLATGGGPWTIQGQIFPGSPPEP